jgi:hypothetical protein
MGRQIRLFQQILVLHHRLFLLMYLSTYVLVYLLPCLLVSLSFSPFLLFFLFPDTITPFLDRRRRLNPPE